MSIFFPRRSARSRMATRRPRFPASMAHIRPAAPPPRMSASNLCIAEKRTSAAKAASILLLLAARLEAAPFQSCAEIFPSRSDHVEQTQARQAVLLQQALVDVLLLELIDLRARHFAAVGSEVAIGFGADGHDFLVGSRSKKRRKKFFFEYGQTALQVFQARRRFRLPVFTKVAGQVAEGLGNIESDGADRNSGSLRQLRRFQQFGVAAQERGDGVRLKALPRAG